jgi:hypothetical protein
MDGKSTRRLSGCYGTMSRIGVSTCRLPSFTQLIPYRFGRVSSARYSAVVPRWKWGLIRVIQGFARVADLMTGLPHGPSTFASTMLAIRNGARPRMHYRTSSETTWLRKCWNRSENILFLTSVSSEGDIRYAWSMTSLAVRMAQGLGLHRDGGLTPFDGDASPLMVAPMLLGCLVLE